MKLEGRIFRVDESFFLLFSSLIVLKPIENVFTFNFTILSQPGRDLLNLIGIGGANSIIVIKVLENSNLFSSGSPTSSGLPAEEGSFNVGILVVLLVLWELVGFH